MRTRQPPCGANRSFNVSDMPGARAAGGRVQSPGTPGVRCGAGAPAVCGHDRYNVAIIMRRNAPLREDEVRGVVVQSGSSRADAKFKTFGFSGRYDRNVAAPTLTASIGWAERRKDRTCRPYLAPQPNHGVMSKALQTQFDLVPF